MIRRPPRSTLFPTRRSSDLNVQAARIVNRVQPVYPPLARQTCISGTVRLHAIRSEEHTSELQSRLHLVCRLLLEKKKTVNLCRHTCLDNDKAERVALQLQQW